MPRSPGGPLWLFLFAFIAVLCLLLSEKILRTDHPILASMAEHVGVAFIVACILGASYEYLLHDYRERMFRQLFDEHREKMFEILKVHLLLTPEQIFDFLSEIAIQTHETPTLYRPARREQHEYTFANSIGYFNTLIDVRRSEIVSVLHKWIDPKSHHNLKFLASDFAGMYQLHELVPDLRLYATRELDQLTDENRGWVLNYVWAVSRCQIPQYRWLGELLCNSRDEGIHEWILFVARQMQDKELGGLLEQFLESHSDRITDANLAHTARSLAALHRAGVHNGRATLQKFPALFSRPGVIEAVKVSWRDLGVPHELTDARRPDGP